MVSLFPKTDLYLTFCVIIVTIGHDTVMAKVTFFSFENATAISDKFLFAEEFAYMDTLPETRAGASPIQNENYALLEFERPVICPPHSKVIASRLDSDAFSNKCRIAFHGNLIESFAQKDYESSVLPQIRIFKTKRREGLVDRVCKEFSNFY